MLNSLLRSPRCTPNPTRFLQPCLAQTCNIDRSISSASALSHLFQTSKGQLTRSRTRQAQITETENGRRAPIQGSHNVAAKVNGDLWKEDESGYRAAREYRGIRRRVGSGGAGLCRPRRVLGSVRERPAQEVHGIRQRVASGRAGLCRPRRVLVSVRERPAREVHGICVPVGSRRAYVNSRKNHPGEWRRRPWKSVKSDKYMTRSHLISLLGWRDTDSDANTSLVLQDVEAKFDGFDRLWSSRISRLLHGQSVLIPMTSGVAYLLSRYAGLPTETRGETRTWVELPKHAKIQIWQNAMLWCLQRSPRRAMELLSKTIDRGFRPPRNVVEECLHFLARHYLYNVSVPGPSAIDLLWRLTNTFVAGGGLKEGAVYSIPHSLVRLVLKYSDDLRVLSFYKHLVTNRVELHVNTMLHFLERFIAMRELELSLELLTAVASSGFNLSLDQVRRPCMALLRAPWKVEEISSLRSLILTRLLETGIQPDIHMYNVILLNAVEAHDYDKVLEMYDMAKRKNFRIDVFTACVLVKTANLSGNAAILDLVLREASEDPELLRNERLISDILSAIHNFSPGNKYHAMLEFYKRHCDLRPLQELKLCGPDIIESSTSEEVNKVQPTKYILGQMILAYNRSVDLPHVLVTTYETFHDLVCQNHPLIAPLAQEDYVANSFIWAFGQRLGTLRHCTTVVQHMLEPPRSLEQPLNALPTVRTWTILAAAYLRYGQKYAAEKVLSFIRDRGLEPDVVTWHTMVNGYAKLQDTESAVLALSRMQTAGHEIGDRTWGAMGKLLDRTALLNALKESIELKVST